MHWIAKAMKRPESQNESHNYEGHYYESPASKIK